jgi:lipoprotein-anchoring transpeptidase ErfK/SrfK
MTVLAAAAAAAMLLCGSVGAKAASLVAKVNVGTQTMTVSQNGHVHNLWKVSTARKGYITPRGTYRPQRLHRMWYSRKYEMSPMPYSVFYHGGYAIHGTGAVKSLGRPASHGCVRLNTGNAATLFSLVSQYGYGNTAIIISY